MRIARAVLGSILVVALGATLYAAPAAPDKGAAPPVRRGEFLVKRYDCAGCHTEGALFNSPEPEFALAGSTIGLSLPEGGIFYPANLTPDPATGIASWSEEDIMLALRTGTKPDGTEIPLAMPWCRFTALTDDDARAIAKYLKSLPARPHAIPKSMPAAPPPGQGRFVTFGGAP